MSKFYVYPAEQQERDEHLMKLDANLRSILKLNLPPDVVEKLYRTALYAYLGARARGTDLSLTESASGSPGVVEPVAAKQVVVHDEQPVEQAMAQPVVQAMAQPVVQAMAQPVVQPEVQPEVQAEVQPEEVRSPDYRHKVASSTKRFAESVIHNAIKDRIGYDDEARLIVDDQTIPGTNIKHILDYLTEVAPTRPRPEGTAIVMQAILLARVTPTEIRNKVERKSYEGELVKLRRSTRLR